MRPSPVSSSEEWFRLQAGRLATSPLPSPQSWPLGGRLLSGCPSGHASCVVPGGPTLPASPLTHPSLLCAPHATPARFGRTGGIPRRLCPVLVGLREEVTEGQYTLVSL